MSDTATKPMRPKFEPRVNVPSFITFETDPANAKELFNEKYGTKSYVYFLKEGSVELVWFPSEKVHSEVLSAGIQANETYKIVKEDVPGKKYFLWWFYDKDTGEKLNGRRARVDLPVRQVQEEVPVPTGELLGSDLESFLGGSDGEASASKDNVMQALAIAVASFGPMIEHAGFNGFMPKIEQRAKEILDAQKRISSLT